MWSTVDRQASYAARLRRKQKESDRQLAIAIGKVEDLRDRRESDRCLCRDGATRAVSNDVEGSGDDVESSRVQTDPPIVSLHLSETSIASKPLIVGRRRWNGSRRGLPRMGSFSSWEFRREFGAPRRGLFWMFERAALFLDSSYCRGR